MNTSNTFFGHPIGLRTLFLTEMWERMSYYGMRALLVLYMTGAVTGFNPGLGWSQVESQAIYGIYSGMVYFMVVPGGWIADNILGHQKAVLIGALIIALGHFTLAIPIEQTFFLGLIFVVLGTGLLKGNISTIVGQLYDGQDDRRDSGYTIFYMSINIGSTLGFLICSYLGEKIGWHWGFGAAGIGMTFGVIQYIKHRHLLGDAGMYPNEMSDEKRKKYTNYLKVSLVAMFMVIGAGLFGFIVIDPRFFAEQFAYFLKIVAGLYFIYLFLFAGICAQLAQKNLDPSLPFKFAIGLLFMALSFFVMIIVVDLAIESSPVGMQWLLLTYLFQTWGELALSPIGLSAFSRYGPKRYMGQMFGLWFLASAIGGVLAGLLGGEALDGGLETISPVFEFMIKYYLVIAAALIALSFVIKTAKD